jgi:uncharacterized protein YnzC (UPF0291/DUF896 family)
MITKELIEQINYYANKAKTEGLTEEEKIKQGELRKEYIKAFRGRFKKQLDNIDIEYVD